MIEQHVAERWIYEQLSGSAGLEALVDDRIYSGLAPEGRVSPFALFQFVPGARDLLVGDAERGITFMEYLVEGIADGQSLLVPHQIAYEIDLVLHDQRESVNYGTELEPLIFRIDCVRVRPHQMVYYDRPEVACHSGGFYRVTVRPNC